MPITGMPHYEWDKNMSPMSHVVPFTYKDGMTFLELLKSFQSFINDRLVPELNNRIDDVNAIIDAELAKFADVSDSWQTAFDEFMDNVNAELRALNDEAVSQLVQEAGSELRGALDVWFDNRLDDQFTNRFDNRQQDTLDPESASLVNTEGTALRDALSGIYTHRDGGETVNGEWTFTDGSKAEHTFVQDDGDLFDAHVELVTDVTSQFPSNENPPGYNRGSIYLVEDGDATNAPGVQIASNRIVMTRRLEVLNSGDGSVGGGGRAMLQSGNPGAAVAILRTHNQTYPRIQLYSENHNTDRATSVHIDRAPFHVHPWADIAQTWDRNNQDLELFMDSEGDHQVTFNHKRWGSVTSSLTFDANTNSIQPNALTLKSGDGTVWEVRVLNSGELYVEEA